MKYLGTTLLSLLVASQSYAVVYSNKLDDENWKVTGNKLECRLTQDIRKAITLQFVQEAGRDTVVKGVLKRSQNVDGVVINTESAYWSTNKMKPVKIYEAPVVDREFVIDKGVANDILVTLNDGLATSIDMSSGDKAVVLPVGFKNSFEEYNNCIADLIPYGYDQLSPMTVSYPSGETNLTEEDMMWLDNLVEYVKSDSTIGRIFVDGHSDGGGKSLINRDLSMKRAELIGEYLVASGVDKERVVVRFHGDMYPIATNASVSGRNQNRRATVRMERLTKVGKKTVDDLDIYDRYRETRKLMKNLGGLTFNNEDEVFLAIQANEIIDALNPASDDLLVERSDPNREKAVKSTANAIEAINAIDADDFIGNEDGFKEVVKKSQERVLEDYRLETDNRLNISEAPDAVQPNDGLGNFEENLLTEKEVLAAKQALNQIADSRETLETKSVKEALDLKGGESSDISFDNNADEANVTDSEGLNETLSNTLEVKTETSKDSVSNGVMVFEDSALSEDSVTNKNQGSSGETFNPFEYFGKPVEDSE